MAERAQFVLQGGAERLQFEQAAASLIYIAVHVQATQFVSSGMDLPLKVLNFDKTGVVAVLFAPFGFDPAA